MEFRSKKNRKVNKLRLVIKKVKLRSSSKRRRVKIRKAREKMKEDV